MVTLGVATSLINALLASAIALACLSIGGSISRHTRCSVRLGVVAMFSGALLHVAGGIFKFGAWTDMIFLAGVLVYVIANLRGPAPVASSPRWGNRIAWGIAGIVLVTLAFNFAQ